MHSLGSKIGALLGVAALILAVSPVNASGHDGLSSITRLAPRSADLARTLGTDGAFLGVSDVIGTVDMSGWTLVSDLAAGEPPRFAPASDAVSPATATGPWSALGSNGSGNGALNSLVLAMAVSGTDLYVGGRFLNAAGIAKADAIAKWNGTAWSALGSNGSGNGALNSEVRALAISGTNLYVGGKFTNAAGIATADYVAKWNGTAWSTLGSNGSGNGAVGYDVNAVAVLGTDVFVGGFFTNTAGIGTADYVARWDGSAWFTMGSNLAGNGAINNPVFALAVYGTDLYVGGHFINAGDNPDADHVARWSGSAWSALGAGGVDNDVNALTVSGTDLYVGGIFTHAGLAAANAIAKWNGSAWSTLGANSALDHLHGVYALAVSGPNLFVGGRFTDAAGSTGDYVMAWNGSVWSALGSNGAGNGALNQSVDALAVSGTNLYVGGDFLNAAGIGTADDIAKWALNVGPDGRIRLGTGAFIGNDVYNTTGAGQSRTGSAARGHSISFDISIQNDGTSADQFKVKATGTAASSYTVKYFRGTTDITASVVAGTYKTPSLAPSATFLITARVTVKSSAAVGSKVTRLMTLTSVGNSTRKDAVKFSGKRA